LKAIWTEDEASFDGEFVRFEPIWSWPKPAQRPHPPIILGAHGAKALARVVDYCEGWIPIGVRAGDLPAEIGTLRRLAQEKERDPASISINVYGTPADRAALAELREAGVTRAIFGLPPAGPDKVLPLLDRYAEVVRSLAS